MRSTLLIGLFFLFWLSVSNVWAESNYCAVPPFLSTNLKPNVVLVMDYSGSMQFPAYYECDFDGYYASQAADCGDQGEVEFEYDSDRNYYGYFDSLACYEYSFSGRYWYESSCDCSLNGGRGTINCLSGNFLNALLMTRIDVALKALIGGKADCDDTYCYLRPQGSKRYVDDEDLHCRYFIRMEDYNYDVDYAPRDILLSIHDNDGSCELGEFFGRYVRVRVPLSSRQGIIQRNFSRLNLTLMVFASNNRYGEIRYSFFQNDLDELVDSMQNEVPYYGTPTGEALYEAYDFLKQSNSHNYEYNLAFIDSASEKDPYYEKIGDELFPVPCRKSFVLLISDGEWNGDVDPDGPAYELHTDDLRSDLPGNQVADVYTLYVFSEDEYGLNSMKTVAAWGGFKDIDDCEDNEPYDFPSYASEYSEDVSYPRPYCNPSGTYEECCAEWDKDGDGKPDKFYSANEGSALENALSKIFGELISNVSSGTSVSVLAQRTESGVNMFQAVFYPQKSFIDGDNSYVATWIGYLYSWWFYNSPSATNIREDSIVNKVLDVCSLDGSDGGDYILDFILEDDTLKIKAYQSKSDGTPSILVTTYNSLDETTPVWEAGDKLLQKTATSRKIYTYISDSLPSASQSLMNFSNFSSDFSLTQVLGNDDADSQIDESDESTILVSKPISISDLVNYIYGSEISGFRSRLINSSQVWKLGDIVYSTPQVVSYKDYDVIFVGANDGMLHAFRLGRKRYNDLGPYQEVRLCNDKSLTCNIDKLGEELWAFIPKNVLPYLRFLMDPNYCHLYYVDLTPVIYKLDLDNDGRADKIVLIGGMRLGGAVGCSGDECVNPPLDTCPNPSNYVPENNNCVGLSSYFALDVTDPDNPRFLWEFTHPDLGFSYSGPSLIKRSGDYYLLFLSGPTNYRGNSGQPLKVFALKMNSQFLVQESYVISNSLFPDNAFGSRLTANGVDIDHDGNTDAIFFGYSYFDDDSNDWKGNVMVIKINSSLPTSWTFEKLFSSDISSAITSKISYGQCFDKFYIYFGTGRYFYKDDDPGLSDSDVEYLYGVRVDPCLRDFSVSCRIDTSVSDLCSSIQNTSAIVSWVEELNPAEEGFFKERLITDPTTTDLDVVFFTTTEPTSNLCGYGGRSRIWLFNCATGESLLSQTCTNYKVSDLKGTLFLQLSGGNIEQISIDLSSEDNNPFTEANNKATNWMTGVAPESSTPFVPPASAKQGKILYWIER